MTASLSSSEVDSSLKVPETALLAPSSSSSPTIETVQPKASQRYDHFIGQSTSEVPSTASMHEKETASLNRRYEIPRCIPPPVSEMAPIEIFVANAIQSQEVFSGNEKPDPAHHAAYREILQALKRPSNPPMLRKILIALRTAGQGSVLNQLALGNNHAQLVHLLIRFVSTRKPPQFDEIVEGDSEELLKVYDDHSICDAHFHLLLAMVSAKSTHVVPILTAVWKLLTKFGPLEDEVSYRIHAMLFNIIRLVPKSSSDIFPIVASRFPFYQWEKPWLVWYTSQCFRVLDYLPAIRQRFLELLIDKCLEIDVNIFIKDNGDAMIDEEEQIRQEEEGNNDATIKIEEGKNQDAVDVLSDKLDALLELLFGYIQSRCKDNVTTARETFYELLPIFESSILTTHKSKFVQYCMFLSCGLETQNRVEPSSLEESDGNATGLSAGISQHQPIDADVGEDEAILYREFASKLLEIIVDPYRATTTRQSASCYLASFISRASYVGNDTVCESISALLRWAEAYIESLGEHAVRAADAREQSEFHALFYTVCQAAFYIMCFRGQEAIQYYRNAIASQSTADRNETTLDDGHIMGEYPDVQYMNLSCERWTYLCGHDLQPLRFCLESVRSEFLHMAHFFSLIEQTVLDKLVVDAKRLSTGRVNKKAASKISTAATLERRRQNGGVGGLGRGSNPLKSFFPFDPLLLRQSHEFIEPLYKYWQGPVEEEDVLVIDEIEGNENDPAFEMDDTIEALAGAENQLEEEEEDGGDDDDDDEEDDDEDDSDDASNSERDQEDPAFCTPDTYNHKILQQKAWTETLKRPRSFSMENGSW